MIGQRVQFLSLGGWELAVLSFEEKQKLTTSTPKAKEEKKGSLRPAQLRIGLSFYFQKEGNDFLSGCLVGHRESRFKK